VTQEGIRCPYHGLTFDRSGRCVAQSDDTNLALKTPCFAAEEKFGFVWVWLGRASIADPALIPDLSYMSHPNWRAFAGHMEEAVPCQLMADNLLDLSHLPVTHANTIGASVGTDAEIPLFQRTDYGVRNTLRSCDVACPPHVAHWGGFSTNINTLIVADWRPPNVITLNVEINDYGIAPEGKQNRIGIMVGFPLTPADEETFHHFFCWARDFQLRDEEMDAFARMSMAAVQEEDLVVIRGQYQMLRRFEFPRPASYEFDGGVNAAHAILDDMFRAQAKRKGEPYETPWYLKYDRPAIDAA